MSLTVACVFVKGPYPYTVEYVIRLRRMVQWHLPREHRFVCLTDQPDALPSHSGRGGGWIETITIPNTLPGCDEAKGYWTKLQLFNPQHGLTGRVLFLDLDTLVVSDLAPIVDYPAAFALCACEMALEKPAVDVDSIGRTVLRRFNASAMAWDAGTTTDLWENWTPDVVQRLQGDQDWYAEQRPDAAAMPVSWFPRISRVQPPWPDDAKVVLVKTPKNHIAAEKWPWFEPMWGGH